MFVDLVEAFNAEHHGIQFTFDEYYKTEDDTSFGGDVRYVHAVERCRSLPAAGEPARAPGRCPSWRAP